jgi:hypothetical protein
MLNWKASDLGAQTEHRSVAGPVRLLLGGEGPPADLWLLNSQDACVLGFSISP